MLTVFFDKSCGLCSAIVKHMADKAQNKEIQFLDLKEFKSDKFTHLRPIDHTACDSILISEENTISIYSDAVVRLFIRLGGIYKFFGYLIKRIPKTFRDNLYKFIANNRHRFLGTSKSNYQQ